MAEIEVEFSVYILRHGDRYDYHIGPEAWNELCQESCISDPPLSALGHLMACETAGKYCSSVCPNGAVLGRIFSSPFLRCIQTIYPTAEALSLRVMLDDSLFEYGKTDVILPSTAERSRYFPLVDSTYVSQFKPDVSEIAPNGALERYGAAIKGLVANRLERKENICIVSHAAGVVAMVAALLDCAVREIPPAAPCSIYRIDYTTEGKFVLAPDFQGTTAHLTMMGATKAWPHRSDESDSFLAAGDMASWVGKKCDPLDSISCASATNTMDHAGNA